MTLRAEGHNRQTMWGVCVFSDGWGGQGRFGRQDAWQPLPLQPTCSRPSSSGCVCMGQPPSSSSKPSSGASLTLYYRAPEPALLKHCLCPLYYAYARAPWRTDLQRAPMFCVSRDMGMRACVRLCDMHKLYTGIFSTVDIWWYPLPPPPPHTHTLACIYICTCLQLILFYYGGTKHWGEKHPLTKNPPFHTRCSKIESLQKIDIGESRIIPPNPPPLLIGGSCLYSAPGYTVSPPPPGPVWRPDAHRHRQTDKHMVRIPIMIPPHGALSLRSATRRPQPRFDVSGRAGGWNPIPDMLTYV